MVSGLYAAYLRLKNFGKLSLGKGARIASTAKIMCLDGTVKIGEHCLIANFAVLDTQNKNIVIGDNVSLQSGSVIYGQVSIGNDTRIATQVTIVASSHNYQDRNKLIRKQGYSAQGIVIGEDVWIGAGAKILDGSVIGNGCVIGANAVVKGTLEPYGVYVGSPAIKVKERT